MVFLRVTDEKEQFILIIQVQLTLHSSYSRYSQGGLTEVYYGEYWRASESDSSSVSMLCIVTVSKIQ